MRDTYIKKLLELAARKRSWLSRVFGLLSVTLNFLVIIPWLAILLAGLVELPGLLEISPAVEYSIALISIPFGLFWLFWAAWAQLSIGGGTPNVFVPPVRLVVRGPFRYCRNPIQLGSTFYYLGVLTWFARLSSGLALFVISQVIATLYHRLIEERELIRRFGKEYEEYRRRTPFLVPRFRRLLKEEDQELAGDGHQDQGHGIDRGV